MLDEIKYVKKERFLHSWSLAGARDTRSCLTAVHQRGERGHEEKAWDERYSLVWTGPVSSVPSQLS